MARSCISRFLPILSAVVLLVGAMVPAASNAAAAPRALPNGGKGPVGWQSYRDLNQLPAVPVGVQTRQFSSYDRDGGNEDWMTSPAVCLRQTSTGCVLAEDAGAGEISSIWFTQNSGNVTATGIITIELDGTTVLRDSLQNVVNGGRGAPFVYPLVANADKSSGGVYIKVPMPYRTTMRVTTQNVPNYYHVAYRHFNDAAGVSTFDPSDQAQDVLSMLNGVGTKDPKPPVSGAVTATNTVNVPAGGSATVATLTGPGTVRALRLNVPNRTPALLSALRLRITFDNRQTVDSPVSEFYGAGLTEFSVRALMYGIDTSTGWYSAWWPMPYWQSARIDLVNTSSAAVNGVQSQVTSVAQVAGTQTDLGYFSTQSRRGDTTDGQDWIFADVAGSGKFVGVSQTFRAHYNGRDYLEGDERVYVDSELSPSVYGTGTEDLYEGGWYFNRGLFSTSWNGNTGHLPAGNPPPGQECNPECDDSAYRLMIADAVPYTSALRYGIEHGPHNDRFANYGSTAFLYTQPTVSAARTDSIEVGSAASRSAHSYTDTGASQYALTGAYDGDFDNETGPDVFRAVTGNTSFTVAIDPSNTGVVLRRTSDQRVSLQSVDVQVNGAAAGRWTQLLGNGFKNLLSDTYALPAALTAGKSSITVTLASTGGPAWTAARYSVDSLVSPRADTQPPAATVVTASPPRPHAVGLTWAVPSDNVGAASYRIYGAKTGSTPTLLGTSRLNSFTYGPVPVGEQWRFQVVAVDAAGNASPMSSAVTATTTVTTHSDFDGDGRDDIVTFTASGQAYVSLSDSANKKFAQDGWLWSSAIPAGISMTGDADGDGKDDVITFTRGDAADVYVSASTGSGFAAPKKWHDHFAIGTEIPAVGDVDGDGKDDIITFTRGTAADVYVSLSDGTKFVQDGWKWHDRFAVDNEFPAVGDVNGDGRADIVTFTRNGNGQVYTALSDGTSFVQDGWLWSSGSVLAGEVAAIADANGDGRDDVVTFTRGTTADVFVSKSTGTSFDARTKWHEWFGAADEQVGAGDFNGDGVSDVITFTRGDATTSADVYVALSNKAQFIGTSEKWHDHFAVGTETPRPSVLIP